MRKTALLLTLFLLAAFIFGLNRTAQAKKKEDKTAKAKAAIKKLTSQNDKERYEACMELAKLKEKSAGGTLLNLAKNDKKVEVRRAAVYALGKIKDKKAVDFLISALKKPNLKANAAMALGRIGDEKAIPYLVESMKADGGCNNCGIALARFGEKALAPLLKALGDNRSYVKVIAIEALAQIGSSSAIDPIRKLEKDSDPEVVKAAKAALVKLGGS